ncbi:MAG: AAA family ATPase, partial [Ectothiorhodospira sp.]
MQLIRLRLEAFGPFTETELVFGDADAAGGLHLIHGPNEAGKSSLLRAMTDLRFGIPAKTPDAFLHPYDRLRISGLFRDEAGHTLGLSRRKGNRNTLQQVPGNLVCPKAPAPATPEQAQALTGGLG